MRVNLVRTGRPLARAAPPGRGRRWARARGECPHQATPVAVSPDSRRVSGDGLHGRGPLAIEPACVTRRPSGRPWDERTSSRQFGAILAARSPRSLISFSRAVSIAFSPGLPSPFIPDHAPVIDDDKVSAWRSRFHLAAMVPLARRSPGSANDRHVSFSLSITALSFLGVVAGDVDADQGEWLVFQLLDERPLVGPLAPSGESVFAPEVEQHHLAAVVC